MADTRDFLLEIFHHHVLLIQNPLGFFDGERHDGVFNIGFAALDKHFDLVVKLVRLADDESFLCFVFGNFYGRMQSACITFVRCIDHGFQIVIGNIIPD